jgi:hypothetical protein
MNDNLRELVFRAYTLCEKRTYGWLRNEEEFRQKFAEVIIEECIDIIDNNIPLLEGDKSDDPASMAYGQGMYDCMNLIEEHFGVK